MRWAAAVIACLASATSAHAANRDRDADRVQAIVERSARRFAVCFGKHDAALPDRMKLVVRLHVAPSGRVVSAIVEHADPDRVTSCVSSVMRTLSFGALHRPYELRVPIVFVRD
jgi:hypothetical protein